jgi:hypothetical protein
MAVICAVPENCSPATTDLDRRLGLAWPQRVHSVSRDMTSGPIIPCTFEHYVDEGLNLVCLGQEAWIAEYELVKPRGFRSEKYA